MVKVLENKVVDLDVMPGTKEHQEAVARAKGLAQDQVPQETQDQVKSAGDNAVNAGQAAGAALGGTVKGVLDTTGNTVGTLGEGLTGTVTGVGQGLGSAALYGGQALDGAGRNIGGALGFGGKGGKDVESTKNTIEGFDQAAGEKAGVKGAEAQKKGPEGGKEASSEVADEGNRVELRDEA